MNQQEETYGWWVPSYTFPPVTTFTSVAACFLSLDFLDLIFDDSRWLEAYYYGCRIEKEMVKFDCHDQV